MAEAMGHPSMLLEVSQADQGEIVDRAKPIRLTQMTQAAG